MLLLMDVIVVRSFSLMLTLNSFSTLTLPQERSGILMMKNATLTGANWKKLNYSLKNETNETTNVKQLRFGYLKELQ